MKCLCYTYIKHGMKHITVCEGCELKRKIAHWESKGTKRGKKYAGHYKWMLNRMEKML